MEFVKRVADLGDMRGYLQKIHSYPILPPEEESALARAWRDNHERDAAHKLVTSHLRLVVKIAAGYRGYGLPLSELVGEGSIGMMRAVEGFDPDRGFRLATYAVWWIRASIQQYIMNSWSLVKVGTTASQKKLFFNLRRLKSQMQITEDGGLHSDQIALIAEVLNVPQHDVIVMDGRLSASDCSLNAPLFQDEADEWQDFLSDGADNQESTLADHEELTMRRALLHDAFKILSQRERHILNERRLKDKAVRLDELARHYNLSRERIRQIETRALAKLQKMVGTKMLERAGCAIGGSQP